MSSAEEQLAAMRAQYERELSTMRIHVDEVEGRLSRRLESQSERISALDSWARAFGEEWAVEKYKSQKMADDISGVSKMVKMVLVGVLMAVLNAVIDRLSEGGFWLG